MEPWRPWDASDEEYAELQVVRELVPETLRDPLLGWLSETLAEDRWVPEERVHFIQSSLRTKLHLSSHHVDYVVQAIVDQGERFLLRVVDLVLAHQISSEARARALALDAHMMLSGSALEVDDSTDSFRLARRSVEGIDEAIQVAINQSDRVSGTHLANAVRGIRALEPNTSDAMAEAIRAVEQAARSVVTPNDKQPRLGKIVAALREKTGWSLVLQQRDDDYPDHRAVVIGMLETLAFAQQNRHGGAAPSVEEATAHVMLASTLVGWFSTGAVRMSS